MLMTLLLVSQVGCEWVEISQQNYKKSNRPTQTYPSENIEDLQVYTNHSVLEYNWNKGVVHRVPNVGNVKHAQFPSSNEQFTTKKTIDTERNGFQNHELDTGNVRNVVIKDDFFGTIERVSNVGKIKRVHVSNTPVKSPSVNFLNDVNRKLNVPRKEGSEDHIHKNHEGFGVTENLKVNFDHLNKHEIISTEKIPAFSISKDERLVDTDNTDLRSDEHKTHEFKNYSLIKSLTERTLAFVTEKEKLNHEDNYDPFYKISDTKSNVKSKEKIKSEPKIKNIDAQNIIITPKEKLANGEAKNSEHEHASSNDEIKEKQSYTKPFEAKQHSNNHYNEKVDSQHDADANGAPTGTTRVDTIENIVKFMKVVTDTISKNTRRSFNSKMKFLQELKNTILTNIEDRIESIWPDDTSESSGSHRRSRSTQETARGHLEFPSSESTLMTISFLTFAVFLIKLVLQVIQTYKNKTMMVAPLVVATAGRAAKKQRMPN